MSEAISCSFFRKVFFWFFRPLVTELLTQPPRLRRGHHYFIIQFPVLFPVKTADIQFLKLIIEAGDTWMLQSLGMCG